MVQYDDARLNIWLNLEDKLSYREFHNKCFEQNVPFMDMQEFSRKVGQLLVAKNMFPELSYKEALLKFVTIKQPNQEYTEESCDNCSKGLGDTVAKITHATGIDKLAELYTSITGKPCGCKERQEFLNKLLPYGITEIA